MSNLSIKGPCLHNLLDKQLFLVCNELESEDLTRFSRAWIRIGSADGVISQFNIVHKR